MVGGATLAAALAVLIVAVGSAWSVQVAQRWSPADAAEAEPTSADRGDPTFETGGSGARDWEQTAVRSPVRSGSISPSVATLRQEEAAHRLPADSGAGRRVVFSESRQRVWLVDGDDRTIRTYLVSGSIYDNLFPGSYAVYSRSEQAWGIGESGTMRWFVRFTTGTAGAAIGFHDIPVNGGEEVQTIEQLGTPLSHGCIRQSTDDALSMWDFADLGTTVVVVA